MKTHFKLVVLVLVLAMVSMASGVFVAKNRGVAAAIRAFTPNTKSVAASDIKDVTPYPVIEFAEKHAYDLGGQAYLWFYGRWRMILEEYNVV